MPRPRRQHQADDAAKAASEAAKVLQKRSQETRETVEKVPGERPDDWTPPKRDDTHSRSMEEIIASRPVEAQEPPEPKVETKAEPEPAKVEPEVPAATETPTEPVVEAPKTVKGKVDGEEYDVPEEEVEAAGGIRAWQRDKAAENRLKKSNEILAENRKAQATMMEMLEQIKTAQKPKEPEVTDDQFIASKMDIVRFGTPEEAGKAWMEIQHRHNKPVDTNAIVEQATNKFRHDQAVQDFDKEFQDIVTNPMFLKLVVTLRNERIPQQKGYVDWNQFYRAIGNEVRAAVGKPTSSPAPQSTTSGTPSQQSEKEAKKAATVVSIPTSSARVSPPQEEKPETREDLIREMRKKRGLPVD